MIRFLINQLVKRMARPRIIRDRSGSSPYLSRYYIIGRPRMADGSDPFDEYGDLRPGVIYNDYGFGVYLHKFHRSDDDLELHNHPWAWALSLVLAGGYFEERRIEGREVTTREVRPGRLNWITHGTYHRVDLREDDAWTLFIVGPKTSSWGFWSRDTGVFTEWRDFLRQKREKRTKAAVK